jgi:hypothetical protein
MFERKRIQYLIAADGDWSWSDAFMVHHVAVKKISRQESDVDPAEGFDQCNPTIYCIILIRL